MQAFAVSKSEWEDYGLTRIGCDKLPGYILARHELEPSALALDDEAACEGGAGDTGQSRRRTYYA